MKGVRKLSNEQILQIYKEYETTNLDIADLAKKFNISWCSLYSMFKRRNLKTIKKAHKSTKYKNAFNENYFSKINTFTKSYLLGFLFADGYIRKRNDKLFCGLGLQKQDKYILELFKSELNCKYKIREEKDKFSIEVQSEQLVKDLLLLGLTFQKSKMGMQFPKIDKEYLSSFVLGFYDGDGTISINNSNHKIQISIGSTDKEFLLNIKNILEEESINCKLYLDKRNERNPKRMDFYSLVIADNFSRIKYLKYIYQNNSNFLIRKYDKMIHANTVLNSKVKIFESV